MTVRPMRLGDQEAWWALRAELWPDEDVEALQEDAVAYLRPPNAVFVWEQEDGGLGGFVEVSLRAYAEGCETSPVGYLEGWFVAEDLRRAGIGRRLVEAAEGWAVDQGCRDMASDALIGDHASREAHGRLGYREVEELVAFAKELPTTVTDGPDRGATVTLRDVVDDNVRAVCSLEVAPEQRNYVAPNAVSLAQAYATTKAWPRAIYAGETPVGFLMLSDDDAKPRYYLWRFMIDRLHQGRGFGRAGMLLMEDYVRTRPGGDRVFLSYVPGIGGPEGFYRALGYDDTGVVHGDEREMVKALTPQRR